MLDKLNKHIFLLLIASLVLILIPASFAEDLNDTQVIANSNEDVQVITDADLDNNIYVSTEGDDDNGNDPNPIHMYLSQRLLKNIILQ